MFECIVVVGRASGARFGLTHSPSVLLRFVADLGYQNLVDLGYQNLVHSSHRPGQKAASSDAGGRLMLL